MPRPRLLTSVTVTVLAAVWLSGSTTYSAQGSVTFRATVTGKARDTGSFRRPEQGSTIRALVGCAVVKHMASRPFGRYTYIVRTGPSGFPGVKPTQPAVSLVVYRFKSGSPGPYTHLDLSGTFAINGHSYADHPTSSSKEIVTIAADGRSGRWAEPDAFRFYPARDMQPVTGFSFRATWRCSTVHHLHD